MKQTDHSQIEVFEKHYATWMDKVDREMNDFVSQLQARRMEEARKVINGM